MSAQRVVHHTGLEASGGATRVARLLVDGLAAQGFETRLTFEFAETDGATPTPPGSFGSLLERGDFGHIHCTGDWPGLLGSVPSGRKLFITLHDCELFTGGCPYPLGCEALDADCGTPCPRKFPDSCELRKVKHDLISNLDPVIVAPSRWLSRLAKTHLFRSVAVIPNGIPWPDRPMRKNEARKQLGINPAARVALFAAHGGMGAAYKSGQAWRAIWKAIKGQVPEALCFAVGGDTTAHEANDLVVWPYVERDHLGLLMAAADVLLYPTQADNHSLVVLEAMAQALPVVAYGVGGIPEQVSDGQTGWVIEPGEQGEFIDAAAGLLANPSRCRDFGQLAFSSGQRRFTVERMVADYAKLYSEL